MERSLVRSSVLAVVGVLLAASGANADLVTYRTYGTFSDTSADTTSNATGFDSATGPTSTLTASGGLTLSFTGVPSTQGFALPTFPGASFELGTLRLSGSIGAFTGSESFTLHVDQISSTLSLADTQTTAVAGVSGSVTSTGDQAVVFRFSPTVFTLGAELYTLPSFVGVNGSMPTGNSLTANVQSASVLPGLPPSTPVPTAAIGGVGLLGLMAAGTLRRRRFTPPPGRLAGATVARR